MPDPSRTPSSAETPSRRGLEILARSLFRQLKDQGYSREQIIGLSSELLQLVRSDLAERALPDAAE
jgi:hypothetical protein